MRFTESKEPLNDLRRLFRDGVRGELSDGQLLDRFLGRRDEAAFSILMERHGPMVLRTCRGVLANEQDAQDAFQATFLILVRRAQCLDRDVSMGPWLFGVCRRVAVRAKADTARRRLREQRAAEAKSDTIRDNVNNELCPILYEELGRLPERYRSAVVLCYLEGCSTEEAARRLGCPKGTILSRLARARERLRDRLTRRGLVLPATAILAAFTASPVEAAPSPALVGSTLRGATRLASGQAITVASSEAIARMMKAGIRSWASGSLTLVAVGLLAAFTTAGVLLQERPAPVIEPPPAPIILRADEPKREQIPEGPGIALLPRPMRGRILNGHAGAAITLAYSLDGKTLATGGADRTVKLWDTATDRVRSSILITPHEGQHAAVMSVAFSPDGKTLAAACDDRSIRLLDTTNGEELLQVPLSYFANALTFSPDGKTLAWAGSNPGPDPDTVQPWNRIILWDLSRNRPRAGFSGHDNGVGSLAFTPDGTILVSGGFDNTVRLWEAATGNAIASLDTPRAVRDVAISPDGRTLAAAIGLPAASDDERTPKTPGIVMLWDLANRAERARLPVEAGSVWALAFSHDGTILASAGYLGTISLWHLESSTEFMRLQGHTGYVYSLSFTPDGKALASAGQDSTIRLWQLDESPPPRQVVNPQGAVEE